MTVVGDYIKNEAFAFVEEYILDRIPEREQKCPSITGCIKEELSDEAFPGCYVDVRLGPFRDSDGGTADPDAGLLCVFNLSFGFLCTINFLL
jgi:hypothetical protein